jgi:glucokinase
VSLFCDTLFVLHLLSISLDVRRAYGSEAGNCALKWYPTGGLYVTGGIIGKMLRNAETKKHFRGDDSVFMQSYKNKGRLSSILNDVPLFAVMAEDIGVRGAQMIAVRMSKQANSRINVTV